MTQKQTAVMSLAIAFRNWQRDWDRYDKEKINKPLSFDQFITPFLEMEKEQMKDATLSQVTTRHKFRKIFENQFEQYYNETYGSKDHIGDTNKMIDEQLIGAKWESEHIENNLEEIISKAHTNIARKKGNEYAPTSIEIQKEIEKSEKPIIPEISDEEIESASKYWRETTNPDMWTFKLAWNAGAKWYREQLKQRQ